MVCFCEVFLNKFVFFLADFRLVAGMCRCDNPCTQEELDKYPTVSTLPTLHMPPDK